jgi:hypothetical protein
LAAQKLRQLLPVTETKLSVSCVNLLNEFYIQKNIQDLNARSSEAVFSILQLSTLFHQSSHESFQPQTKTNSGLDPPSNGTRKQFRDLR